MIINSALARFIRKKLHHDDDEDQNDKIIDKGIDVNVNTKEAE